MVHFLSFAVAGAVSVALGSPTVVGGAAAMAGAAISVLTARWLAAYHAAGVVILVTAALTGLMTVVWSAAFVVYVTGQGVSALTIVLVAVGALFTSLSVPSDLLREVTQWEVLLRSRWSRAGARPRRPRPGFSPMVSVQVPIHAEPPDIVIRTLDALSHLNYPDFEVMVIDNNTTDESLWRPVQRHCSLLGPRFRFLHVEGISGAKAGALNWARQYVDPRAEILGVIDADYIADPSWLAHTVGYFEDASIGFIQCPHAYRDYESSTFTRMANAEYALFFSADMLALDEHGAGITVGTMSVIRLAALDGAGGWAEWCMTEDSELAIRIHALGYGSVYVERPYGRGLVPETWEGYRKQRFRWTYGPVQELRVHGGLFRPGRKRKPSALNITQRMHHANHGLAIALSGTRFVGLALGPAVLLSMIANGDRWPVSTSWVAPFLLSLANKQLIRWILYRKVLRFTGAQIVGATLVQRALSYTIGNSAWAALWNRPAVWNRTDKFRRMQSKIQVFQSAGAEVILTLVFLTSACVSTVILPFGVVSAALTLGFLSQALTFALAPALSFLAHREARKVRWPSPQPTPRAHAFSADGTR